MPDRCAPTEPPFKAALEELTLPGRTLESAMLDNLQRALASAGRRPQVAGERFAGRYRLARELGRGGMGVVWLATDEELQRPVAIKVLTAAQTAIGLARLRREARAVARLAHPNVAAIYDVDIDASPPFIVMEYIEDGDLARWLDRDPRPSWQAVLSAFEQAGMALAAAHCVGLVHRDFKPANVVVGGGRVRVVDFGLARGDQGAGRTPSSGLLASSYESTLTRSGVGMGTPAYMAPEQHDNDAVTAAADIFAFACSLYEGLYGQRPYQATSVPGLAAAKLQGPPAWPPPSRVPARLYPIVARGLAPSPNERWPSMAAFLDALRRAKRGHRRTWALASCTGIAVAAFAWTGAAAPPACASQVGVFARDSAQQRATVLAQLDTTAVTPALREAVALATDRFRTEWIAAASAVCDDEDRRALPETTTACLASLRTAAEAQWARASATPEAAMQFALDLDVFVSVKECGPEALRGLQPQPADPDLRREIAQLQAWAQQGGASADAATVTQRLRQAEGTGHQPTIAAVQVAAAELAHAEGETEAALQWCEAAFASATASGADWVAFDAARSCTSACSMLGRVDEARRWYGRLSAAADRLGLEPVEQLRARAFLASALARAGALDEARRLAAEVDADSQRAPHHTRAVLDAIAEIGMIAVWLDDMPLAVERFERGYASTQRYRPDDAPIMIAFESRLATVYRYVGRFTESEALFERTLAQPLPAQQRLFTQLNYAQMLGDQPTRIDDADARLDQARTELEAEGRANTVDEASLLAAEGQIHVKAGRGDEARRTLLRAREIYLASLDPQNIQVQNVDDWLARADALRTGAPAPPPAP